VLAGDDLFAPSLSHGQIPSPRVRLPLLPASTGTTDAALRLLAEIGLDTEPALMAR
jgi:hypothetical protein